MTRMDPEDVRKPRTTSLSGREVDAIKALIARTDPGAGLSTWLRDAALEKLARETGYADDVRRAAPKSANRRPRVRKQAAPGAGSP